MRPSTPAPPGSSAAGPLAQQHQEQQKQQQQAQQQKEEKHNPNSTAPPKDRIPPIQPALSIFVPLGHDLTDPSTLPRNRVERLHKILASIDAQQAGSHSNLSYMFEREKQRVLMESQQMEESELLRQQQQQGHDGGGGMKTGTGGNSNGAAASPVLTAARAPRVGLSPVELDRTIWNMTMPPQPGQDYNVPEASALVVPPAPPPPPPARDHATAQVLQIIESSTIELQRLGRHIAEQRGAYGARLQQELARMESIGTRPEERGADGQM